jgi:hypothetical protein
MFLLIYTRENKHRTTAEGTDSGRIVFHTKNSNPKIKVGKVEANTLESHPNSSSFLSHLKDRIDYVIIALLSCSRGSDLDQGTE